MTLDKASHPPVISSVLICKSQSLDQVISTIFSDFNQSAFFWAVLGLRCYVWAFSSCGEQGLLFLAVRGLLIAVASRGGAQALGVRASVVVAHGL